MKAQKNLKLRIEQNGKVTDRHLYGKDQLTIGRSPENDIVLYGEKFPKRLRMFVPTNGGYELRLAGEPRGEVIFDKSRLLFSDLLLHDLLPKREGAPILPLTPGKSGHLILDGVRIDFNFDSAAAATLPVEVFSPGRALVKSLKEDIFFKALVAVLLFFQFIAVQWAGSVKITPPELADQTKLFQKVQKIAATFHRAEEPRFKTPVKAEAGTNSESSTAEKNEKKKDEAKTAEATDKKEKGYGADKPGQGVNLENVGVLALIGGSGASDANSGLMNRLIKDDLAKGLDQVMTSGKLSAGRSQSANSSTDLNALLAYGEVGAGQGGNSSIDDILKSDVAQNKPAVKLEKTGKVSVEQLDKVSGSQEAMGARNDQSLLQVLSQNMGRLKYIYDKYLKANPEIGGKVSVEVTINADGAVANAVVLSSEIPLQEFQREILNAIRRWKYDAIAQGQMKVVYPIIFIKPN